MYRKDNASKSTSLTQSILSSESTTGTNFILTASDKERIDTEEGRKGLISSKDDNVLNSAKIFGATSENGIIISRGIRGISWVCDIPNSSVSYLFQQQ